MANFKNCIASSRLNKGFNPTVNHENTIVHKLNDLETLFSQVLGSFFGEGTHYEKRTAEGEFKNLWERIQRVSDEDKEYVLKIAELGRLCNMIDYPLNILTAVFNDERFLGSNFIDEKGRNKIWPYSREIIQRSKDIVTIMSTQLAMFDKRSSLCIDVPGKKGTALPMQLRKCLKKKFEFYDKFKLSKGISKGSDVTLNDCMRLLRPKPKNEDYGVFYKALREGTVKIGNDKAQIKTELVKKGQKASVKEPVSNEGLTKAVAMDNLMNIVKNLVTLFKNGVFNTEALTSVCTKLRDPKEVKHSRLLPFRFYSAYLEVSKLGTNKITSTLKEALSDAMDLSITNIDSLEGVTAILVDRSGSMQNIISEESVMRADELAAVQAAIAYKTGIADIFAFSTTCKRVDISNKAPIIDIAKAIIKAVGSGGTELCNALETIKKYAKSTNTTYDSLLMLSDNDCYGYDKNNNILTFKGGRGNESPDTHMNKLIADGIFRKVFLNNLLGNDFAVFNTASDTKNLITGFSENYIDIISLYNVLGSDRNDIRKVIELYLNKMRAKR